MESYEEWRKKREKGALLLALVPGASLLICALLIRIFVPDIPNIIRYNAYAASFILGTAFSGPRLMKKATFSEQELLTAYITLVMISVLFFFLFNGLYLLEVGVITTSIDDLLWFATVAMFPSTFVAGVMAYEILDSRRTKQNLTFRLKRFLGRLWFAFMFWMSIFLTVQLFSFFTSDEHILVFATAFVDIILLVLVFQSEQIRKTLEDLMSGEW